MNLNSILQGVKSLFNSLLNTKTRTMNEVIIINDIEDLRTIENNKVYHITRGIYEINSVIDWVNKTNITIYGNDCTITMSPTAPVSNGYGMLSMSECNNIQLNDIKFNANSGKRGTAEVPAHAIQIMSSNDIGLTNVHCVNNVCDGILIGAWDPYDIETHCSNIRLHRLSILKTARNGISIINGNDIVVENSLFTNCSGLSPESGIDIESDEDTDFPSNSNIRIVNNTFSNNNQWGVMVSQKGNPENIEIRNNNIVSCGYGIFISSILTSVINNNVRGGIYGVQSVRYEGEPIDGNLIDHNILEDVETGVHYTGQNGVIRNNIIYPLVTGVWLNGNSLDDTHCHVDANYIDLAIKDGTGNGINSNNTDDATISNNTIRNCDTGIIGQNGDLVISSNTLVNNVDGITLTSCNYAFTNNHIEDSTVAINLIGGDGTLTGNTYVNCITEVNDV